MAVRCLLFVVVAALLGAAGAALGDDRVYPSPEAVKPLAPGSAVPSVEVRTVGGGAVDLAMEVRDAGALLVFYRGGW